MKGKACSAEFMRRLEGMVEVHEGKHKDLVKFINHQTCVTPQHVNLLLRSIELRNKLNDIIHFSEEPQPSILIECLTAPDPKALALQAIQEGWTVEQTRQEANKLKAIQQNGHISIPPPHGSYHTLVMDPPWKYGIVSWRQESTVEVSAGQE